MNRSSMRFVALIVLVALTFVIFVALPATQSGGHAGAMNDCPMAHEMPAMCPLGLDNHVAALALLTQFPPVTDSLSLLLIVLTAFTLCLSAFYLVGPPFREELVSYQRQHREQNFFNLFSELFSQGILNPRVW